jgi:hypothetical protein
MTEAATAMDEIRRLISQSNPTRQASGVLIWSVIASGIWKSSQNCNGGSPR